MIKTRRTTTVPLMLRLPLRTHARTVEAATALGKSMNEYIVSVLDQNLDIGSDDLVKRLSDLEDSFRSLQKKLQETEA